MVGSPGTEPHPVAWQAASVDCISDLALSFPSSSSTELEITLRLNHQLCADGKRRGLRFLCMSNGEMGSTGTCHKLSTQRQTFLPHRASRSFKPGAACSLRFLPASPSPGPEPGPGLAPQECAGGLNARAPTWSFSHCIPWTLSNQ